MLNIELLADHREAIPQLKALFESVWPSYYDENGPGNAESDLKESAGRNQLPIAVVAVADGHVCGSAALKKESVKGYQECSPWLAALVVAPVYRNRGIGEQLIIKVEQLATEHGYREIYAGRGINSGLSENMLKKREWRIFDDSDYSVSGICVYVKQLSLFF
jgi:GNAT superfamily N-acetyltransferase